MLVGEYVDEPPKPAPGNYVVEEGGKKYLLIIRRRRDPCTFFKVRFSDLDGDVVVYIDRVIKGDEHCRPSLCGFEGSPPKGMYYVVRIAIGEGVGKVVIDERDVIKCPSLIRSYPVRKEVIDLSS